jgi:hypothetical protein
MGRKSKDEIIPIQAWPLEGRKPRWQQGSLILLTFVARVFRATSIPFRPLGRFLDRRYLRRFTEEVLREFEGAFPGEAVTIVQCQTDFGWPRTTIRVGEVEITVWTHMGEYGGRVAEKSEAGVSSSSICDELKVESSQQTFYSVRQVATFFAERFRPQLREKGLVSSVPQIDRGSPS